MGCCGQGRAALSRRLNVSTTTPPTVEVIEPSFADIGPPVRLQYFQTRPLLVRGPATGRVYQFSGAHPEAGVDARDAAALLRTNLFRPTDETTSTEAQRSTRT
jgi:hypothetical protein